MAPKMNLGAETIGGWLVALILAIFTLFTHLRRGKVDESIAVMGEWKKLLDSHQAQIATMLREISDLRTRLCAAEKRITELEDELREKNNLIVGLQRQIAQNSRSVAFQMNRANIRPGVSLPEDDDAVTKLNRAGDNSLKGKPDPEEWR